MPKLNDIKKVGTNYYIYQACVDCGKKRYVPKVKNPPLRCKSCAHLGNRSHRWQGGQCVFGGYTYIYSPNHPRGNSWGYVKRAVLVLEEKLGRPIKDGYDCHHRNEIKSDDSLDNLEELEHGYHSSISNKERRHS